MTGKELSTALRSGRRVYGTLVVSTSPRWPEAVRGSGVDFVFIDTEHIPIDRTTLSWMCQTYTAMGLPPIVRIPSPSPAEACKVLDGGACGIIAPYVESPKQVRELVGATKLRPLKGKRMEEALQDPDALEAPLRDYLGEFNSNNILAVNIESVPAVENLDAILSVPGLDAVIIGPHDLSVSMGIPEQYADPAFDGAVRDIIQRARSSNVAAGMHFWESMEQEIAWARAGANLIVHSGDISIFAQTLRADLAKMRDALGDDAPPSDTDQTTTV
ncbi:MAG: aldolase/citrate lyase family protein [Phycisphaerae bacterium]|nr:aldolase/citrate lyase family protein [Phycisphaerae bacterium]